MSECECNITAKLKQERDELAALVAVMRDAFEYVDGCVEAAYIEGLADRLAEQECGQAGSLRDLVERRLLHVTNATAKVLSITGPDALRETVARTIPVPRMTSFESLAGQYAITLVYDSKYDCDKVCALVDAAAKRKGE